MPKVWMLGALLCVGLLGGLAGHRLLVVKSAAHPGPHPVKVLPAEEPTRPIGG